MFHYFPHNFRRLSYDEAVEVVVVEHIRGVWDILKATEGWKKVDSNTIEWMINLKPEMQYWMPT